MQPRHLGEIELSLRWNISHRALERRRSIGHGPDFLILDSQVLYRLSDVEAYEQDQLQRAIKVNKAVDRSGAAPKSVMLTF